MNESSEEMKLHAVINGARSILENKNFKESARAIFDYCREMTGAQSGYVALLSDDGHENEVLFLEAGGRPCTVDLALPMPIRGLRELSYESHKAVYENHFMKSEWIEYIPAGHVVLHNVMFAPLNLDGKTVGIIGLANKPNDFTEKDAEIAAVFGDLAAIALENSRYLELLDKKTSDLEKALSEIKSLREFYRSACIAKVSATTKDIGHSLKNISLTIRMQNSATGFVKNVLKKNILMGFRYLVIGAVISQHLRILEIMRR